MNNIDELTGKVISHGDINIYTCVRHRVALLNLLQNNELIYESGHDMPGFAPPIERMLTSLESYIRMNNIPLAAMAGRLVVAEMIHCQGAGPEACGHCCLCHNASYGPRALTNTSPDNSKGWRTVKYLEDSANDPDSPANKPQG